MMNRGQWGIDDLVEKAESYVVTFEFDLAARFYRKAVELAPRDTKIMDALVEVLMELGETEEAKQIS
jgi:cytochrome c-type biogenesis protein CcmH/NrfG